MSCSIVVAVNLRYSKSRAVGRHVVTVKFKTFLIILEPIRYFFLESPVVLLNLLVGTITSNKKKNVFSVVLDTTFFHLHLLPGLQAMKLANYSPNLACKYSFDGIYDWRMTKLSRKCRGPKAIRN